MRKLTYMCSVGVTVCQPTLLTWSGGAPPYFVDIFDAKDVKGTPLEQLVTGSNAKQFTWTVNVPAGSEIVGRIRDSTGLIKNTATFTVQDGSNSSCL
jgi:hypothetical protein